MGAAQRTCPSARASQTPPCPTGPHLPGPVPRSVGRRLPGSPGDCLQPPGGREATPGRCGPGLPVSATPTAGGGGGDLGGGRLAPSPYRGRPAEPEGGAGAGAGAALRPGIRNAGTSPAEASGLGVRSRCPHSVSAGALCLSPSAQPGCPAGRGPAGRGQVSAGTSGGSQQAAAGCRLDAPVGSTWGSSS